MGTRDENYDAEEVGVIIRQASPSDARAILSLYQEVGRETPYLTFGPNGVNLTPEEEMNLIQRFAVSRNSIMLVAEVDDQLVGVANLAAFDAEKQKHVAELGICLVKEYWGYGIASMLMEDMIDFAREADLKVITLEVVSANVRAVKLYERFGFEIVGKLQKRLAVNYRYLDSYVMELIL